MGVPNLQNLQHSDVLEKLKMQVGLMDPEFAMHSLRNLNTPPNGGFSLSQSGVSGGGGGGGGSGTGTSDTSTGPSNQPHNLSGLHSSQQKHFPFTTPNPPNTKEGNCNPIQFSFFFFQFYVNKHFLQ